MNTSSLKLVCPKCGEEFSNAETIKIIDKIDSFRKTEKSKDEIQYLERGVEEYTIEIESLEAKTQEYIKMLYELNEDNSEAAENKKSKYKDMVIINQMDIQSKKEDLSKMKTAIEKLKSEIAKINNRFDIKEFLNTTNVLYDDNNYAELQELLKNNNDTIRFRAKLNFLASKYDDTHTVYEQFLSKYYISSMFSSINKGSKIIFYEFKTQKSDKIKIGNKYGNDDVNVLTEIENWVNDIGIPEDKNNYKFLLIPSDEISYNSLYPYHYVPKYSTIKEYLDAKNTANLSEVAEIIIPQCNYDKKGNVLKTDDYYSGISGAIDSIKNSLSKQDIPCERNYVTDCILQKDDIVVAGYADFSFLSEEPQKDIYANGYNHIVLRTKKGFSAEYLYNYLISNIGHFLFGKINKAIFYEHEEREELINKLSEIPVILPKNGATEFDCSEFNETVNKFAKK